MQTNTTVTIVLTVYNMEACLRETIDSIAGQTYRDLEIVCVNDGSTDGSAAILDEYARADERFVLIDQPNAGAAKARNRGLDAANGAYVMMLDADDIYDADMVEKLVGRMESTQSDVVICRCVELDDATGEIRRAPWTADAAQIPAKDPFCVEDMYDYVLTAFIGWPWDKLYRRSFLEEQGLRYPDMNNSEDLYFVFLSLIKARRMSFYDEVLIKHRINRGGSLSNSRLAHPTDFYEGICLLKAKLQETPELYRKMEWGFLNWAFDYTIWNIESLPAGEVREQLAKRFDEGGFPELELDVHGREYFSMRDYNHDRYVNLMQAPAPHDDDGRPHRVAAKLARLCSYGKEFFEIVQRAGIACAYNDVKRWRGRKQGAAAPVAARGTKYCYGRSAMYEENR